LIKKIFTKNFLGWFFGIVFAISALTVAQKNLVSSFLYFVVAIFLLPPLTDVPSRLIKKPISNPVKFILGFVFFLVATNLSPARGSEQSSSSIVPTDAPSVLSSTDTVQVTQEPVTESGEKKISPTDIPVIFYEVTKVIDGDTIDVLIDGKKENIRLIGIDSPEAVDPRKPVECFAKESSNKAKEILTGKRVFLEADPSQGERDKYNRLLRYVFLEDGVNFNKLMVEEGYAHEYTYDLPYKYQDEFIEAEKKAKQEKLGLWADDACLAPTPIPTVKSTKKLIPTSKPVIYQPIATQPPVYMQDNTDSSWACDCSKTCPQMSSCQEAYYQLNTCGCSRRDGDNDGVPCESLCN